MVASNNLFKSDLPFIHNIVQNSLTVYPKEVILAHLRDFFSYDTYYRYGKDAWGFPNTVDNTNLPLDAGLTDNVCTRLFVGENYRQDGIFYPAVLIKHGGAKSVPISINRERGTVFWEIRTFEDGYGNVSFYKHPKSFIFAGAWEGSIIIDIKTRSLRSRDDLVDLTMIAINDVLYEDLKQAGVVCKPPSVSGTSEEDDRNDKVFRQTITLDIRTEWRREIPVKNIIEVINFAVEFVDLENPLAPVAQNLTIDTNLTLLDVMLGIPATPIV